MKNVFKTLLGIIVFSLATGCTAQEHSPIADHADAIFTAERFMHVMYRDLSGKNLTITAETYRNYDVPGEAIRRLHFTIGFGARDFVLGYSGGCLGTVVTDAQKSSSSQLPVTSEDKEHAKKALPTDQGKSPDCHRGPIHPEQLFSAVFLFSSDGSLKGFNIEGSGLRNPKQLADFGSFARSHLDLSEADLVAELKKRGAKFSPSDREDFVKALPLVALEPFIGKTTVKSIIQAPLVANRNDAAVWPLWAVTLETPAPSRSTYKLMFEPFQGDLISLYATSPTPAVP